MYNLLVFALFSTDAVGPPHENSDMRILIHSIMTSSQELGEMDISTNFTS